jgi:hypothetical protein
VGSRNDAWPEERNLNQPGRPALDIEAIIESKR